VSWRYLATRLHGDGTESLIANEVPLSDVSLTSVLSGPDALDAKVVPEVARLKDDHGRPVFRAWSTAIYAEADGRIRHGSIVVGTPADDSDLTVTGVGFTGYLSDMPYTSTRSRVQTDPLVEVRHMWAHVQGHKHGDLGVVLDNTRSPVRIGTKKKDVEFDTGAGEHVEFEAGPYKLNWWDTDDLAGEVDSLAEYTPFDYRMEHAWDGERIAHRLRLGYPSLGRRRHDLRFVVGENVVEVPKVSFSGDDYASEVLLLGAGEGRKMTRGRAQRSTDRLRRVAVITDGSLSSRKRADAAAEADLRWRRGETDLSQIVVRNHPHARVGSYVVGDDIFVQGMAGWGGDVGLWVRVIEIAVSPGESDDSTLTVIRSDKVGG